MFSDAIRSHLQAESQRALAEWLRQRQEKQTRAGTLFRSVQLVLGAIGGAQLRTESGAVIDLRKGSDWVWRAD